VTTDDRRDSAARRAAPPLGGTSTYRVPPELRDARRRIAASRASTARSLERANDRRRVAPAAVVTALVLAAAGVADVAVQRTVPRLPLATPASTVAPTGAVPLSADAALVRARRALAIDVAALGAVEHLERSASLEGAAAADAAAAAATGPAGGTSSSGSGSGAAQPTSTLPPLPSIPPLPAAAPAAATAHATTGPSGVG